MTIRLKPGAPPDSELYVRVGLTRTYRPNPAQYQAIDAEDTDDGVAIPAPTNLLEVLLYDKKAVEDGETMIEELTDCWEQNTNPFKGPLDFTQHVWEIVDQYGNVWSEECNEEEDGKITITTYGESVPGRTHYVGE